VGDILAPCRFSDYLGVERPRLRAYLETVARKHLKDPSGATGTVDDVFADVLAKAYETGVSELPRGPEWQADLGRRVRNKADGRDERRDRRLKSITSSDDPEALAPPPRAGGVDTPGRMSSQQEAALYLRESFDMLSTRERSVLQLKVQGYTDEEISRKLGIPLRTVERMLWRIRRRIRGDEE
jgi:RNA polymerase sigma factor (sigma-70 family)